MMTISKQQILSIFRSSTSVLLAAVLAFAGLFSSVYADVVPAPDSISINFGPHYGAPTSTEDGLGVVPVKWNYWNNADSDNTGNNKWTSGNIDKNKAGTMSLINNTGVDTGVSGTWNCANTYMYSGTRPTTTNNAILFYGYLDDTNAQQSFKMISPYFSYDIYYYASTDSNGFRYATINNINYYGDGTEEKTKQGTNNWGTRVTEDIDASDLKEGVNYLKVSSSNPGISISGVNKDNDTNKCRGSFGALQIVNTANSQSTVTTANSLSLSSVTWTNDLTGETNQEFNPSATGYRIYYNGTENTFSIPLEEAQSYVIPNVKLFGAAKNLTFTNGSNSLISYVCTNGVVQLGKTNQVYDFSDVEVNLEIPDPRVVPQGVVKFNTNNDKISISSNSYNQNVIPGAYLVNGSTITYASIVNGVLKATETVSTAEDGANLFVKDNNLTDNNNRTLNSLTTQRDYLNDKSLTVSSGMITLQTRSDGGSHWIKNSGTITSGYQNAEGEYDLYLSALGSGTDLCVRDSTIIDNPKGKLNLIKTGSGTLSLGSSNTSTYSGKTSVLEGKLYICENIGSQEFYIAQGAQLNLSSKTNNGTDIGDFSFTAKSLTGNGTLEIGNSNNKIALTLQDAANDGSKFAAVNAYGKSLTMNNSELHTAVLNSKSIITLSESSIVADTFNSSANSSVVFDATSTLDAAIVTSAGALTLDIPANRTMDISEAITGAGGFVKAGEGTLELTANNAYSNNTQINGGVLDLTEGKLYSGTYFGNSHVYVNEGGTLKVNNFGYSEGGRGSLGGLAYFRGTDNRFHMNGGTVQVTETFSEAINRKIELQTNGGTLDIAEDVELVLGADINGSGALTKTGAGTLELTYANTYAGGTTISQGEVNLSGSGTLGTGTVAIAENAVLNLNHEGNARFDNSVTGVEVDSEMGYGKIYKNGNGVLKIYNPTEDAFVAESFVVNAGKLDFKGYFKGSLQIGDGATLSPGNSVGPIYETGDFTLASGAKLLLEVGAENGETAGDLLQVAGTATFVSGSIIEIGLDETSQLKGGDEFELKMIVADNASDELATLVNSLLRSYYFTDLNATYKADAPDTGIWISGRLDPNAVPEPSTWALLLLGVVALFLRKRVRN